MIPKNELIKKSKELKIPLSTVEKDYVIGWVLSGISWYFPSETAWAFKGGTCLKKCYFGNYRFSEDLDFTLSEKSQLDLPFLHSAFQEISRWIYENSGIDLLSNSIRFEHYHNLQGNLSVQGRLYYKGPLLPHVNFPKIKLDLLSEEILVHSPERRPILHAYSDILPVDEISCYIFEELFAEKLRALLERARPRDLYDVIHLHRHPYFEQNPSTIVKILERKCHFKNIPFPRLDLIENHHNLKQLKSEWKRMLHHQLPELEPFDLYWNQLPQLFEKIKSL